MKKIITLTWFIILIVVYVIGMISCDVAVVTKRQVTEWCERSYFEGQKDAINGDIRIKYTKDSCYVWIKSPWHDTKQEPIYHPNICK